MNRLRSLRLISPRNAGHPGLALSSTPISHLRHNHTIPRETSKSTRTGPHRAEDHRLSQGHLTDPTQQHPQDTYSQAARSGFAARKSATPSATSSTTQLDAASPAGDKRASVNNTGNKEGIGFAEQVGSASATAKTGTGSDVKSRANGAHLRDVGIPGKQEEAKPPGLFATIKRILGIRTSTDDVKQNRGGGEGVTGTGTNPTRSRKYHSCAAKLTAPESGISVKQRKRNGRWALDAGADPTAPTTTAHISGTRGQDIAWKESHV